MRAGLDAYAGLDSPVHRAPAWLKVGAALAFIVSVTQVSLAASWALGVAAALVVLGVVVSGVPVGFVLGRVLALEPLVFGVAVLAWQRGGWALAGLLVARSTLCVAAAVLLGATTPFVHLLEVLKRARVPPLLLTVLALMSRYVSVLGDEAARMDRARRSRTFVARRRLDWTASAALVGQLFVRATNRAERIYAAMCARGWR